MGSLEFFGFAIEMFDFGPIKIPPLAIAIVGAVVVGLMVWWAFRKRQFRSATIKYSDVRIVKRAARVGRHRLRPIVPILRILAVILLVLAFMRPRLGSEVREVTSHGVDIMLCLDISSSMQAEDFQPNNRLYVAKEEIKRFVEQRLDDRIGLIVFAKASFTQCPLTVDYDVLLNFVDLVDFGMVEDGTAIGMAVANGVNRLKDSEAESKVMILLTDGDNNSGEIDPETAANLAATFDIKIYTIGVGKEGNALFPVQDPLFGKRYVYQPTTINEESLQQIAEVTGGKYFRARSGEELEGIYEQIDQLEKTEIEVSTHRQYQEYFMYFALVGFLLLGLEILLSSTVFRKLP